MSAEKEMQEVISLSPDTWAELIPAIGTLVFYWAMFESMVEFWVALLLAEELRVLKVPSRRKPPRQFSDKIKYLEHSVPKSLLVGELKAQLEKLLNEAKLVARVRNIVVHGSVAGFRTSDKCIHFKLTAVSEDDRKYMFKDHWHSIDEILAMANAAMQLSAESGKLLPEVLKKYGSSAVG